MVGGVPESVNYISMANFLVQNSYDIHVNALALGSLKRSLSLRIVGGFSSHLPSWNLRHLRCPNSNNLVSPSHSGQWPLWHKSSILPTKNPSSKQASHDTVISSKHTTSRSPHPHPHILTSSPSHVFDFCLKASLSLPVWLRSSPTSFPSTNNFSLTCNTKSILAHSVSLVFRHA